MKRAGTRYLILAPLLSMLLFAMSLFAAQQAQEEREAAAKEHFLKGKALVEAGAYEKAIIELGASYDLNPNPVVLYNIGICYDELTRYAEAVNYYTLFIEEAGEKFKDVITEVALRIEELSEFFGFLKLAVNLEGAEVIIDDNLLGYTPLEVITIDTGEHDLEIRKIGYRDIEKKVTVVSGQTIELAFEMVKIEPEKKEEFPEGPEKKKRKKLGPVYFWTAVGLAGAAAITAAVTGGLAIQKDSDIEGYYRDQEGWKSLRDDGKKLALTTDIMIGVSAAAGAGALILLFFTDFKKKEKKPVSFVPMFDGQTLTIGYERTF